MQTLVRGRVLSLLEDLRNLMRTIFNHLWDAPILVALFFLLSFLSIVLEWNIYDVIDLNVEFTSTPRFGKKWRKEKGEFVGDMFAMKLMSEFWK